MEKQDALKNEEKQKQKSEKDSNVEKKTEVMDIDPASLEEVEGIRKPLTDLDKHITKPCKIESVEIVRIPSPYAKHKDGKVHVLRITGEVVEKVEHEGETIEFMPNELIDLEEDADGKLLGLPKGETRKWQRLKKTLRITDMKEIKGKSLPMKVNTNKRGQDFLGFLY